MNNQIPLGRMVSTEERFARSTNIGFDFMDDSLLPDFKFTNKTVDLLQDLFEGTEGSHRDRAWSIVGPYGSGKSIFSLFTLKLLCGDYSDWIIRSLSHLEIANPELKNEIETRDKSTSNLYMPVIAQGSTSSLDFTLCSALLEATNYPSEGPSWVSEQFIESIQLHMETIEAGIVDSKSTIDLYRRAIHFAKDAGYKGLIVVIDEFGKFLETAAHKGSVSSVITSQYLAELASSSKDSDLMYFTILHQGMSNYMTSLSEREWNEWTKIQGRFRNVEFTQDEYGLYQLIASSLYQSGAISENVLESWTTRAWEQVKGIPYFDTPTNRNTWPQLLPKAYPFLPVSLFALPRLSRILSQNERSLFSFLGSDDPLGFKSFLEKTLGTFDELPSLPIDYLYDYFISDSSYISQTPEIRRSISETENALERLSGDNPFESRIVKAIGTINLLRAGGTLPANEQTLIAALDVNSKDEMTTFKNSLDQLLARKIIIYRKYSNEYRLWQGSDFDFETFISTAKEEIKEDVDIPSILKSELDLRPIPARRHSITTGASRHFSVEFSGNSSEGVPVLQEESSSTDGSIIYSLPESENEVSLVNKLATRIKQPNVIQVVPKKPIVVNDLAVELAALRKVVRDQIELQDDPIAMQEMSGRIQATEEVLRQELEDLLEPNTNSSNWFWKGIKQDVSTRRRLQGLLSDISDEIYSKTPHIPNELINREHLSTAMVVGLKKLVAAILTNEDEEELGLSGNGPEVSIYRAVFGEGELHTPLRSGKWRFTKPSSKSDGTILPVWSKIERFFKSATDAPKDFGSLYKDLSAPPFGLKSGLIPLLVWLVAHYNRKSVSVYENGTYQREWNPELFDRFIKSPSDFTIRWLKFRNKETNNLLKNLILAVPNTTYDSKTEDPQLTRLLEDLFTWYQQLPDYSKRTFNLTQEAKDLRQVLTSESDPINLVFKSLPSSIGIKTPQPMGNNDSSLGSSEKNDYPSELKYVLAEIEGSYQALLQELLDSMYESFNCKASVKDLRNFFIDMDEDFVNCVYEPLVKSFLLRARSEEGDNQIWVESITATLANQAPRYWIDHHFEEFKDNLALTSLSLRDARKRLFANSIATSDKASPFVRVTVEKPGIEMNEVFLTDNDLEKNIEELAGEYLDLFRKQTDHLTVAEKQRLLLRILGSISEDE